MIKVEAEMFNGKVYKFEFNDNVDELDRKIEFSENNGFFLTNDGTRVIIKYIMSYKVITNE